MSTCSIEQDEEVVRRFCRTPGTPTKVINQTPRRSSRKRSLFQPSFPTSPAKSDDLGPMSPLSITSNESCMSAQSPCFSPNGKFTTPPKTPSSSSRQDRFRTREVNSSAFPSLKIDTPKSHRKAITPRRSQRLTPKKNNSVTVDDILRDLTTPPKSSPKMNRSNDELATTEDEGDSSENLYDSTPRRSRSCIASVPTLRFGIKPLSSESFYGSKCGASETRSRLFIDSLGSKAGIRKRSLSIESISSNKSFVSGSGRQNKKPRTRNSREKRPHVGVWHGVKKPKKMKFSKNVKKPSISPNSRVAKMLKSDEEKPIQLKTKRLLEDKPVWKGSSKKKKRNQSFHENEIIDSFPHNLIKRKSLPSVGHPSSQNELDQEADIPDSRKKFMKYGKRKATVTLLANVKLQYKDGRMRLESPKKRRKLYSGKTEEFNDFCDEEDKISDMKENISNILNKLEDDKDVSSSSNIPPSLSQDSEMTKNQVLEGVGLKGDLTRVTHSNRVSEIENDSGNGLKISAEELIGAGSNPVNGETGLEKTANILSEVTNVLSTCDLISDDYKMNEAEGNDKKTDSENMFPLFYKRNWSKSNTDKEVTCKSSVKKKTVKVPDNQYLLDAGQKSIGIVTCSGCGVMYQVGDFADEAMHRDFHNHLPELRFTGWTNERVVGRYADGRVIMIVSSDPKSWWHKVTKIVDIVDQELGFAEGSVDALYYKTVYLFINEKVKQIVGCLIAEECNEGYKMFPPLEGVDVDSCSKDPSPCKVGISRIWTALNHRRRGVAKRMIDCMRRTFLFGEIVPMDLVAFSVPSPSGKLLAQNVTGKLDFLVYGFV